MMGIISFLLGPIGRYLAIGVAVLAFLGWIRHDAAAPYKSEITALRRAADQKDAIIKANADRYLEDQAEKARLEAELQGILNASNETDACKLTASELERLRILSAR